MHQTTAASGGRYVPKALSGPLFRDARAADRSIIPVENGTPGAVQAGVPAWIDDLLAVNDELKARYGKGLA